MREQALGRSEHRQVDRFREWALERSWGFDGTYRDPGVSGFRGGHRRHGDLGRILNDIRSGQIDPKIHRLGIESFDRLTRENRIDAVPLFSEIVNSGVPIIVQSLGFMWFTREECLRKPHLLDIVWTEMGRSHMEAVRKSEISLDNRVAEQRAARETKTPMTARCPPWLHLPRQQGSRAERAQQRATRQYVVIEDRAGIVVLIFELAADGFSASEIANRLNAAAKPTFTGAGLWKRNAVQWLLANKAVLGVYVPGHYVDDPNRRKGRRRVPDTSAEVEGFYPAIISEDLWRRARKAIENRAGCKRTSGGRKGPAMTNLVSRLGKCQTCGSQLHYANGYLRCELSLQRAACSNNIGFPYERLEGMLMSLDELSESVAALLPQPAGPNSAKQVVAELEAETARKSEQMFQMVRSFTGKTGAQAEAAMLVMDELNADIDRLKQRLSEAREQLARSGPDERKGFLARFKPARALLGSDDPQAVHGARIRLSQEFHRLIAGIVLHPAKQRSPDRYVSVHLKLDADGVQTSYAFSPETLMAIHFTLAEGRTGMIGPSVLHLARWRACRRRSEFAAAAELEPCTFRLPEPGRQLPPQPRARSDGGRGQRRSFPGIRDLPAGNLSQPHSRGPHGPGREVGRRPQGLEALRLVLHVRHADGKRCG